MKPIFSPPFGCGTKLGLYRGTTYGPTATRKRHSRFSSDMNAVDGSDLGDPVLAQADGVVFSWEPGNGDMRIRHEDGYETWSVHMRNPKVKVGDRVQRGQQIAELGNTGIGSTGPHLHVNHARFGRQIQIVWDGVPYPASIEFPTKGVAGPLIAGHCPGVQPKPKPEDIVQVKSWAGWAGPTVELVPGAVIENAAGVKLTTAAKVPPVYPSLGETPKGRAIVGIETANGAPAGTLRSIAAYVKPAGVVSVTPPVAGDCSGAVTSFKEAAIAAIEGVPV